MPTVPAFSPKRPLLALSHVAPSLVPSAQARFAKSGVFVFLPREKAEKNHIDLLMAVGPILHWEVDRNRGSKRNESR